DVGRQTKIHFVENIEQLCPKLQHSELPISSVTKRGVFDQRQVKIAEAGTAKRVAAERAKAAAEWPGPARAVNWDCKKRAVCLAQAEVVLSHRAARGKYRHGKKIGAIRPAQAYSGLLDSGIHREGRAARQCRNVQDLPPFGELLAQRLKKAHAFRSEEHTSELQSPCNLVCRLLLEKKNAAEASEWCPRDRSCVS